MSSYPTERNIKILCTDIMFSYRSELIFRNILFQWIFLNIQGVCILFGDFILNQQE
jgi:hypothetical protein